MVDWVSLAAPFVYLGILVGSLATFYSMYRKRKAARVASLESWFGPHLQRDIYLSLLHLEQIEPGKDKPIHVPDSVIKAALLRRATENISRIITLRTSKQALSTLVQRGSVGDDLWQRFLRAEKELEAELEDVVKEANALAPGWGNTIFQSANEMAVNARLRKRVDEIQATAQAEHDWWEAKRATTHADFMRELDLEKQQQQQQQPHLHPHQQQPQAQQPQQQRGGSSSVSRPSTSAGERTGSDEDAVLVEAGGPASPTAPRTPTTPVAPATPATPGSTRSSKKKKGRK